MARPQNRRLWDLLHSFTETERVTIRKVLAHGPGRKPEMLLAVFDTILASERHDDPEIDGTVRAFGTNSNPASIKRNLYDTVLRAMRSRHERRNDIDVVLGLLADANVLMSRSLNDAALERLERAIELTTMMRNLDLASVAVGMKLRIVRQRAVRADDADVLEVLETQRKVFYRNSLRNVYGTLSRRLMQADLLGGRNREALAVEISQHPALDADMSDCSVEEDHWRLHLKSYALFIAGDLDASSALLRSRACRVLDDPGLANNTSVTALITNLLINHLYGGTMTQFDEDFALFDVCQPTNQTSKEDLWYHRNLAGLIRHRLMESPERMLEILETVEKESAMNPNRGPALRDTIEIHRVCCYISLGQISLAKQCLARNSPSDQAHDHTILTLRFLEIRCYLAEGEFAVIEHRLRSIRRSLPTPLDQSESIADLIKLFRKASHCSDITSAEKLFTTNLAYAAGKARTVAEMNCFYALGHCYIRIDIDLHNQNKEFLQEH